MKVWPLDFKINITDPLQNKSMALSKLVGWYKCEFYRPNTTKNMLKHTKQETYVGVPSGFEGLGTLVRSCKCVVRWRCMQVQTRRRRLMLCLQAHQLPAVTRADWWDLWGEFSRVQMQKDVWSQERCCCSENRINLFSQVSLAWETCKAASFLTPSTSPPPPPPSFDHLLLKWKCVSFQLHHFLPSSPALIFPLASSHHPSAELLSAVPSVLSPPPHLSRSFYPSVGFFLFIFI